MWIDKSRSWIGTVLLGGFALPHIWTRVIIVTAISVAVTVVYREVPAFHFNITSTPFALIGLPLGIFLGFRNNTAYDRFWEGRKLWGALVNTSRSFTRQLLTLLEFQHDATDADPDALVAFERDMVRLVIAYVHALRHHLRDSDPFEELARILPAEIVDKFRGEVNVPIAMLQHMGDQLVLARRKNWVHPFHVNVLEGSLTSMTDIQGACERIKSTPIPFSYTVLMHRIVAGYCTLLPFGLESSIGWATPVVVMAISYAFFGLDAIGDEIEDPFGDDVNDLPLHAISRMIEINLRRRINDEGPEPLRPTRGVLS
jgi:ion channel-forming bestrophin family protein